MGAGPVHVHSLRAFVVAAVLALAGCGSDDAQPNVGEVEAELVRIVQDETGTGGVVLVDCPDDVQEGDVCDVTATGGLAAKVRVTRLDDGKVEGEVVRP